MYEQYITLQDCENSSKVYINPSNRLRDKYYISRKENFDFCILKDLSESKVNFRESEVAKTITLVFFKQFSIMLIECLFSSRFKKMLSYCVKFVSSASRL